MMKTDQKAIHILYDGSCPFCTRYVLMLRLKDNLSVHLIDARMDSPLKKEITKKGYDLDRGMVVQYEGNIYYGDQAMTLLSLMSTPVTLFNRLMTKAFKSKSFMRLIYPVFSFLRLCTVLVLGRGKINNLKL